MQEVKEMFRTLGNQPIRVDCATLYSNELQSKKTDDEIFL
jgi:homoserine trans-succinylase